MAQNLDSKQLRVLEITLVADVSANTFTPSAVVYNRDGINGTDFTVDFDATAANPVNILLNEGLPSFDIIRITGTIQA